MYAQAKTQVRLLQPMVDDVRKLRFVLDLPAVDRVMDWLGVPEHARASVWEGIEVIHEVECHNANAERYPAFCYHGPDVELVPTCVRCRARWRCRTCHEFVLHVDSVG